MPLLAAPGPRLCGLCELRYAMGERGAALLLLHLLLVFATGEGNSGLCSQHKHACRCMCSWCLILPLAAAIFYWVLDKEGRFGIAAQRRSHGSLLFLMLLCSTTAPAAGAVSCGL